MKGLLLITVACIINLVCLVEGAYSLPWPPEVDVYYIKFNYQSGYSYDALKIKNISAPEWASGGSTNKKIAYIINQSSRKIKAKFWIDRTGIDFINVYADKISGQGIGDILNCRIDFNGSQYSQEEQLTCDGSVQSSVGIRNFTWRWYAFAIDDYELEEEIWIGDTGPHDYYTVIATPKYPNSEPVCYILDYACDWANGAINADKACVYILNGMEDNYSWYYNCHRLSSNFVHLVTSIGISAQQHKWAVKNEEYGDMAVQKTNMIDPIGSYGYSKYLFSFHQWAEAANKQRDPTTAFSRVGSWGSYEDFLYEGYYMRLADPYQYYYQINHSGQYYGCEAPGHRYYYSNPPLYSFQEP